MGTTNGNGTIQIAAEQADRAVEVASGFWVIGTSVLPNASKFACVSKTSTTHSAFGSP